MSSPEVGEQERPRRDRVLPRLHVVTGDAVLGRRTWEAQAIEVLRAGGADVCLHLRGLHTDGATLHGLAEELLPYALRAGAGLFVNDRVDVALAIGLDGVHLGSRSLPVGVTRTLVGADPWVGASCHDGAEAAASWREGADYVFLGTIFATPTHAGVPGMGLERLATAVERLAGCPVIGIGGIDPTRAPRVLDAGAYGVAVVRGVWDARDPAAAVRQYLGAMEAGAAKATPRPEGEGVDDHANDANPTERESA